MENRNKTKSGPDAKNDSKRQDKEARLKEPTGEKDVDQRQNSKPTTSDSNPKTPEAQRASNDTAQSQAQQSAQADDTITNQDSQRQVTNSGDTNLPMGEKETEGA